MTEPGTGSILKRYYSLKNSFMETAIYKTSFVYE